MVGAQGLDVVEVVRRARREDLQPRGFGELDGEDARGGAAAVDQDRDGRGQGAGGEGQLEGLIETLALFFCFWRGELLATGRRVWL